jgi:hypothetical protein
MVRDHRASTKVIKSEDETYPTLFLQSNNYHNPKGIMH